MGKLDDLRRLGGSNVAESTGAARGDGLPGGLDPSTAVGMPARLAGLTKERGAMRIPLGKIEPDPRQPRAEFDEEALDRLAESLRARGQLQPVRVRWDEGRGAYVLLCGERRWRAARRAGLAELSAIIVDGDLPDEERLMIQLVENALREDLRPVEQARAYRRLMDARGWSGNRLSKELHIAQSSVVRALSLLELPEPVQDRVDAGDLAATVAHELTRLPDPETRQAVARAVVERGLTRTEATDLIEAVKARRPAPGARPEPVAIDLGNGCVVRVSWRKAGGPDLAKALRLALKWVQEQGRGPQQGDGQAA